MAYVGVKPIGKVMDDPEDEAGKAGVFGGAMGKRRTSLPFI